MDSMNQGASSCVQVAPLNITVNKINGEEYFDTSFAMFVANEDEEGLYNLFFHNCPNYNEKNEKVLVNFTVSSTFS